jgi:hypothetical protein
LCSKGYTGISWFLVFLPLIAFAVIMVVAVETSMNMNRSSGMVNKNSGMMNMGY